MIWTDDDLDAAREMQRKKLEYARELEEQIELRRAMQREEQHELEEFERKFQPDDRSPAKWLVDGGHSAPGTNTYRSAFRFPLSQLHAQQEMPYFDDQNARGSAGVAPASSPLPSAGEPSGGPSGERDSASSQRTRFRITDLQDQSDRLRERAQQLEWKRILDEQVRENARLKEQEELARRREDAGEARDEMMFLRDLQLRAQRRMGLPEVASEPSPMYGRATPQRQYETFATQERPPPGAAYQQQQEQQQMYEPMQHVDNSAHRYSDPHHTGRGLYAMDAITMPPPAPTRLDYAGANAVGLARESVAPLMVHAQQQQQSPQLNRQVYESFDGSRSVLINEYRSLLAEIRREREELRHEKDEVRKEKEVLRVERALLQLENEKMASLIETQRRLHEQQLEMQLREPLRQTQQQQQQQRQQLYHPSLSTAPSPAREYYAPAQSVQRPQRPQRPPVFDFSQLHQAERSIAALELESRSAREAQAAVTPDRRPSPMSMADFATPRNRLTPNVVDSPRRKRLSYVRRQSVAAAEARYAAAGGNHDDDELGALDQSLIGESVFVALRPDEVASAVSRGPPRITETASPRRDERRMSSERGSELRSSRVIKSRGFYNFESEAGAFPTRERKSSKSKRRPSDAHVSPARTPHSVEKTRFSHRGAAAAAIARDHDDRESARRLSLSASSSDGDRDQSARRLERRHYHTHDRRHNDGDTSDVHNTSSRVSDADESSDDDDEDDAKEDGEDEPELSRSLFQVKVLV